MGLLSRILSIFGAKMNKALDKVENPAETLDYSYTKQLSLLRDVKRGLADVATSKQRLRMQVDKLQQQHAKLQAQAEDAVRQGRDDIAREALRRQTVIQGQIDSLQVQVQQLDQQQAQLADASQVLQARVDMFRSQKEALKAQYSASKAQAQITESFTGLSKEMNDIGSALERTQNRIEEMQARSTALDDLVSTGALEDYTAQLGGGDDIDRQLRASGGQSQIEDQLAHLKRQLGTSEGPKLPSPEGPSS